MAPQHLPIRLWLDLFWRRSFVRASATLEARPNKSDQPFTILKVGNKDSNKKVLDKWSFRLPRRIEFELAKFLNTFGFKEYGSILWNLATENDQARRPPISAPIVAQILSQARHDPSVAASGENTLSFMRRFERNLSNSWGVKSKSLFGQQSERTETLFVIPKLGSYHEEQISKIAESLRILGCRSFLVVVTDQKCSAARSICVFPSDTRVIFWHDHCSSYTSDNYRLFATFIHVFGPAIVVVSGSALGLAAIGRCGRALEPFHRLFCSYDSPRSHDQAAFRELHYLRLTAPHAVTLTFDEENAKIIRQYSAGLTSSRTAFLGTSSDQGKDKLKEIFGEDFGDHRSDLSRRVIGTLLAPQSEITPIHDTNCLVSDHRSTQEFDITVTIVFHGEKDLAVPALASLADMVEVARSSGVSVEARAMLDKADEQTRCLVEKHGTFLDEVTEVCFGDLGLTRNAGTAMARGRYLSFLDGDDLWGAQWLRAAYRAANASDVPKDAIWHPEDLYSFFSSDCDNYSTSTIPHPSVKSSHALLQASVSPYFEKRHLLMENQWSANCFALTDVFRRFPYRPNDWQRRIGIEDWRWNLETLGSGLPHLIVPDTVHIIREKDIGSLGKTSNALGLLPILI